MGPSVVTTVVKPHQCLKQLAGEFLIDLLEYLQLHLTYLYNVNSSLTNRSILLDYYKLLSKEINCSK